MACAGSPQHCKPLEEILHTACTEAEVYRECGVDGVIVENMHDVPYLRGPVGPHTVSAMTRVGSEVHRLLGGIPLGVQLLSGNNGLASHTSSERELTAKLVADAERGSYARLPRDYYSQLLNT